MMDSLCQNAGRREFILHSRRCSISLEDCPPPSIRGFQVGGHFGFGQSGAQGTTTRDWLRFPRRSYREASNPLRSEKIFGGLQRVRAAGRVFPYRRQRFKAAAKNVGSSDRSIITCRGGAVARPSCCRLGRVGHASADEAISTSPS